MDLEVQKRIKEFAEQYGPENVVVILGGAEPEAAGIAAETVTNGDPTFAGPLAGVSLGLAVYHIVEPEVKEAVDKDVYEENVGIMEMVLDVEGLSSEVRKYREQYSKYKA
ncbi:Glycine/sarcosine/betaine reductase complex component A1 [Thermovenabulum gondwanense]|uniref:Glycine/sarcosine/betaine reductase complex component A1 n=3 Tax=Thermovenabulum gondwanense TaxID=520767 RepID=A0A161PSW2_9FIRM|nr:Glycine/sarcosine/betaine reductase complex component A1 [Thermovenabulum gondwanense]